MSNRNIRLGRVSKVSNDKGPHKMMEVEADGKKMMVKHLESFGMQSVPHMDADVIMFCPDGDEGKAVCIAMPRPKDRQDQQKEGEVSHMNHDTGNRIFHDKDGNSTHSTKKDFIVKSKGIVHLNPR